MGADKTLLIHGGTILTMSPAWGTIEQGYIVCKEGMITALGRGPCTLPESPETERINAAGKLVLPGLINTHTHAPMSLFRGIADDLPLMEWLNRYIFPLETRLMSPDFVYVGTLLAGLSMVRSGTTTVGDGYFFEHDAARALRDLGIRGVMAQGVIDFPNPQYQTPQEGFERIGEFINHWSGSQIIRPALFCHSPYTCSPESLVHAHRMSLDTGVPYMIHLAETHDEVEQIRRRYGTTPVRHLERLGILGPQMLAVHCVWLDEEEIRILAAHQVKIAHCPESNMKLAAGIAPIPALLRAGVTVGLGTDGCASNNNLDMFQEMDMAAKLHKVATGDPTVMDAPTVLAMATTEAARALGLADEIGSLEPGKRADIICLDLNQPHLTPMYNIPSQLVYAASGLDVDTVIVNGEILLCDRRFTRCDPGEIMDEAKRWAGTIANGTSTVYSFPSP